MILIIDKCLQKTLSLALGLILSCSNNDFSYAGDGDPIMEHTETVEIFKQEEKKP